MNRRTRLTGAALVAALAMASLSSCRNPRPPGGTTTTRGPVPTTSPTTGPTPTTSPTTGPTPTTSPTTTPPGNPGPRVDNPYAGAKGYVNADWAAKARASGGSAIAGQSTALWLDRIAAIQGTASAKGLRAHMDAALAQAGGSPLVITIVIYDLPNRDCAALASNGELKSGAAGLARYKTEYIDPITAILSDAKYRSLRVSAIIEPDSLPNLVTNTNGKPGATDACNQAQQNGDYVQGVQYALGKLHGVGNVYSYIDVAHGGWLGWPDNMSATASLMASTVKGAPGGADTISGFITNTANYTPTKEPFIQNNGSVNGQEIRQSKFYDWNPWVDETGFAGAMRNALIGAGLPSSIGMLIDTSRNGWGGSARPAAASTSTDLNTFIDASRIDRRIHRGNWCNQSGAGIGERPRANPDANIDAYVWIKPPGESDGSSTAIANDEGKGFDQMCDPSYGGNARNGNNRTGSLSGAPIAGQWFDAQFRQLIANAYPRL